MFYEVKESDGWLNSYLSSDAEITQEQIDAITDRFKSDGPEDWNIDDICEELSKEGIEAVTIEPNGTLWI